MSDDYEVYRDEDNSVIGVAECGDQTVLLISAPGKSINWEHMKLFPTLDKNRVVVATPMETIIGVRESIENDDDVPKIMGEFLNNFLNEAVLVAVEHFDSLED
jgi:hypothetical protein